MPVQPPSSPSVPCRRIPSGRGPRKNEETTGQSAFGECVWCLFGKRSTDDVRRKCAIALIHQQINHLLVDETSSQAVQAAARFIGKPSNKEQMRQPERMR